MEIRSRYSLAKGQRVWTSRKGSWWAADGRREGLISCVPFRALPGCCFLMVVLESGECVSSSPRGIYSCFGAEKRRRGNSYLLILNCLQFKLFLVLKWHLCGAILILFKRVDQDVSTNIPFSHLTCSPFSQLTRSPLATRHAVRVSVPFSCQASSSQWRGGSVGVCYF